MKFAVWWWMLPLLLLTTLLTVPRLDADGLWYDEVWSVINAGGAHYGAMAPWEIWAHLATNDPDQGIAYPLLLSAWGSVVGWSELATRLLSLFAGLLTLAGLYRVGREWMNPMVGLLAAACLGVNAFYIHYLHELRVFSLVTLSAVLVLGCYGRILWKTASHPLKKPKQQFLPALGLVIGGLGLLYTHYFAATLLLALGMVHVGMGVWAFIKRYEQGKNGEFFWRGWVHIVLLALLVALLFAPWLPVLMNSIARTSTRSDVHERALATPDLLETIGRYFLNWDLPGVGMMLLGILGIATIGVFWRNSFYPASQSPLNTWRGGVLVVITLLLVLLVVGANAFLQIIEPNRARYLLVMWVPLALSSAFLSHQLLVMSMSASQRWGMIDRVSTGIFLILLIAWFLNGIRAYADVNFLSALDGGDTVRWRTMTTLLQAEGQPKDVFVFYAGTPKTAYDNQFSFEHSTHDVMMPHFQSAIFLDETHRDWAVSQLAQAHRVWYGVDKREPITAAYTIFEEQLAAFIPCAEVVNDAQVNLTLYARYGAFCPQSVPIMLLDVGIGLVAYQFVPIQNTLLVPTSWIIQAQVPPDIYSVSVQLLDDIGHLVAQKDDGLSHSHFTMLISELDLSEVPFGDFQVRIVVYEWQTGMVAGDIILADKVSYSQSTK
jgi:uncharacterized membrane protein